jgi:hypothetical protein
MTPSDIPSRRLTSQHLAGNPLGGAEEVVRWFGAVQAQDYGGAKWAIAQRTPGETEAGIDALFDSGAILRTHAMRPTWHFVAPEDIRWLLALTAPRVHAVNAYQYRRLELDGEVFARSQTALARALEGGRELTRTELAGVLQGAGIAASGLRLAYLMMHAELDALLCSGPRRGKQFTYALLDERAPGARSLPRDEALAELATRYFTSHGPALVQDLAWWSSLTAADARAGIGMAGSHLTRETIGGRNYWFAASSMAAGENGSKVHLLPNYDEYLIAYKDYSPVFDPARVANTASLERVLGGHLLVVGGRVAGGWRRTLKRDEVAIEIELVAPLRARERAALEVAVERYGHFAGLPAALRV